MTDPLQTTLRAVADPTRRQILALLAEGERNIEGICDQFPHTRPAIAKHLAILKDSGVVSAHKRGRERIHRLNPERLRVIERWLDHYRAFWDERLDRLKIAVESAEKARTLKQPNIEHSND